MRMAAKHGTRQRYNQGCRCGGCSAANNRYQQGYRQRKLLPETAPVAADDPGPVELAVQAELDNLPAPTDRPGVAAAALAMARLLDNPRAVGSQPSAAKVLAGLLRDLRSASVRGRYGRLKVVREMTDKEGT
ncbi:hypothetical protein [uncultured Mycobacterium sp.]|uniref:hypothetical protein n=1 Tax=uncultured Mycobacterium sp. TaxID=171292 RepID=UPI0035CB4044